MTSSVTLFNIELKKIDTLYIVLLRMEVCYRKNSDSIKKKFKLKNGYKIPVIFVTFL